jgi:hypothetical protein
MNVLKTSYLQLIKWKAGWKGLQERQNLVFSSFFHADSLFPTDDKKDKGNGSKQVKPDGRSKGFGDQFKGTE